MDNTNQPVLVSHFGRKLLSVVVPLLLVFSAGFVLGMTSNAKFPNLYLPFGLPLPSLTPPSSPRPPLPQPILSAPPPPPATLSPPLPPPPAPSPSPQKPQTGLMGFRAPNGVMHNMTDEELFWRASMAPKVLRTPFHRVAKVAFLFLVRGDLPLRPLWEKFFAGHDGLYSIYVHAAPSYIGSPPSDSVFYGRMIPSQNTSWGDISLVAAQRRLLANALLDLGNERFVLLSESCAPVYGFPAVRAFLTGSGASFVDSFANHDSEARYNAFFARRSNITLARWRKGSEWFEMDRALAVEVVADDTYFPAFREYCARVPFCLMDEHYLPTLLSVLGWPRNANRSLTHADWSERGAVHPRTYRRQDVTAELIGGIRGGAGAGNNCSYNGRADGICFLFARKFAPDTVEPLLALAPKVMGFG